MADFQENALPLCWRTWLNTDANLKQGKILPRKNDLEFYGVSRWSFWYEIWQEPRGE
jgi:hypothetical protein